MNLNGKTVIITGAKRIGKTVAYELAKKGANLAIIYNSSRAQAEEAAENCIGTGVTVELFQADLSSGDDVLRVSSEIFQKMDNIAGLVHMAAPYPRTPLGKITMDDFDKIMRSISGSAILLGQEIGLRMKQEGNGKIVFFSDWSVLKSPYEDYLVYNAAKASVDAITKTLARELAPEVSVNAIAPGPILRPPDLTDEENEESMSRTPLHKWGGEQEIAKAVLYLFESDFTTGVILPVDGGRSIA